MTKPICVITGVGDGTGTALARRFARGGYQVAMLARNRDRLETLHCEIDDARAYECDISDLDALSGVVDMVHREMGPPTALIHNAVSATFKTFLEADSHELEYNFRVNTTSLYQLARELAARSSDPIGTVYAEDRFPFDSSNPQHGGRKYGTSKSRMETVDPEHTARSINGPAKPLPESEGCNVEDGGAECR